jgi:hypothetical protein
MRVRVVYMLMPLKSKIIIILLGPTIIGFGLIASIVGLSLNATEFKQHKNVTLVEKIKSCLVYSTLEKINIDPIKIINHVNVAYLGKWSNYIKTWEIYRNDVQSIIDGKGSSSSELRVLRLTGNGLTKHLIDVEDRLTMIKCLQYIHMGGAREANPNNY